MADTVMSAGADVVSGFSLGVPFDEWQSDRRQSVEKGQRANYTDRVIEYLQTRDGNTAPQQDVLKNVTGKTASVMEAIRELTVEGVVISGEHPKRLSCWMVKL
jgi:hypothetical protein